MYNAVMFVIRNGALLQNTTGISFALRTISLRANTRIWSRGTTGGDMRHNKLFVAMYLMNVPLFQRCARAPQQRR
jgi:hypothetical protein